MAREPLLKQRLNRLNPETNPIKSATVPSAGCILPCRLTKDEAIEHLLKETYQQAYKAGYIDGHKDGTLKTIPTPEQA
ncbi:MAG: hypothetical protein RBR41_01090 [Desulfovibrio sp.]|uniref:hypothetical protein n=1 Tax=Desulfovibrio sp. TaxID=885 RepID=UPI002A36F7AB|nr:hypothetical protein [Desulfovibrio sp.]MDY0258247.1 hypothetical protein [Desulfovibrio sp.]